ncbi:hypothetical protein ABXT08_12175 [Chryseobacterium sp. NRRL B-14859]|uniref:hypothetical protein n=1 Tax=Chryseobacterium sp. NRRL B-14859 TaxID=1562763 RepID=UPI0033978DE1
MKEVSANNSIEDLSRTFRKISLWKYALGIGFRTIAKDGTKTLTVFIEKKYRVEGVKYIKRKGYALQHMMDGKNNRISIHKRVQVLKET